MWTPETSASPLPAMQQALDEIVRQMGFTKLKPKQPEAIVAVVSGNDTFVSLLAGYSKSVVVNILAHTYVQWKAMADRRCCCWSFRAIIGERERANLVVRSVRFFCIIICMYIMYNRHCPPHLRMRHVLRNSKYPNCTEISSSISGLGRASS